MQTIGERLEEARKKKGISIREAAEATKIRGDYLQKFESNQFDIGLTEIYTRGFLRTYANYLKVPADRLLNDYAALGRGEIRPRQPNREVYGRMDITVATAENGEAAAPAPEAAPEPSHANRGPQRPKAGSSLPSGPDPALVFKYVKIGGAVVIAVLLLLIVKSLFFSGRPGSVVTPATPSPRAPLVTFVATRAVHVKVARASLEDPEKDGEILFASTLQAGDQRSFARTTTLFVTADPPTNLDLEVNGKRQNLGQFLAAYGANVNRAKIEAPAPTP
jgi:transcriptional regulator with XRE-family HTH domain